MIKRGHHRATRVLGLPSPCRSSAETIMPCHLDVVVEVDPIDRDILKLLIPRPMTLVMYKDNLRNYEYDY